MNPSITILCSAVLLAAWPAALHAATPAAAKRKPNIVLMMADDLGWRDLGIYGSELYQTPHIDALARAGMRFPNAYSASPLCSPTRAAVLTGQTPGRIRITTPNCHEAPALLDPIVPARSAPGMPASEPQNRNRLPLDSVTFPQILKQHGYTNGFFGKWHLGRAPHFPEQFGFDRVVGGREYPGPPAPGFFGPWDPEKTNMPAVEGHPNADDAITDEAIRFIEQKKDEPFFVALWFFNVHAPFQGDPELVKKYAPLAERSHYQNSPIMGSMVETLDRNVGRFMDKLRELGLGEDTLVIFTSDNGGNMYDRPEGRNPTNNHPLRAGKGNNYEGGSRVPLIASWPGVIPADRVNDTITISYDWFPTLLEAAGIAGSAPKEWPTDGVSVLPALRGESMKRPPVFSMFGHTVRATGNLGNIWMRDGQWKLLRFFHAAPGQNDHLELYDLEADPGETRNLAAARPGITKRMNEAISAHLAETQTLVPVKNPAYNPNFKALGFSLKSGGVFFGKSGENTIALTANQRHVTLRYEIPAGSAGSVLEVKVTSNSAVSAAAGPDESAVFGPPVPTVPNSLPQTIRLPLGRKVSGGVLTLLLDLEQPGYVELGSAKLVE